MEQRAGVHEDLRPDRRARARRTCTSTTRSSQPSPTARNVNEPVVTWSTVPGARDYEVQINCSGTSQDLHDGQHRLDAARRRSPARRPDHPQPAGAGLRARTARRCSRARASLPCAPTRTTRSTARAIAGHFAFVDFTVRRRGVQQPAAVRLPRASVRRPPDAADIITPASGQIVGKSPLFCWKPADMNAGAGTTSRATHYWVAIARDTNFTTIVQRRTRTSRAARRAKPMVDEGTLYYWQVVPRPATAPVDGRRTAGPARRLLDVARASSTRRCRRRRSRRSAARRPRAPSCSSWTPVPGAGQELHDRDRAGRLVLDDPRVGHHRRHLVLRDADLPGRRDGLLARAREQRRRQGPRLVGDVDLRADAARAGDHDARAVLGRDVPGAQLDAGRRRDELRGAGRVAGRQRARDLEHPEHRGQLHEDDRHRARHGAGAGGLQQRLPQRLHGDARRRPHDRRAGRHQDAS